MNGNSKKQILETLKDRHDFCQKNRYARLAAMPYKISLPYIFSRFGKVAHKNATLFFGRTMRVVVPEGVSVKIWRYGFFEEDVCYYLMRVLEPGGTLIDVGGHFGFFSMLGRELVGAEGTVVTFEPMPTTRDILTHNMTVNAAPAKGEIVAAACGDQRGEIAFKDLGILYSAFATSKEPKGRGAQEPRSITVPVTTLDEEVERLGLERCDLIKIDAESAEYEVIAGGMGTIRTLRPALILEAGERGDSIGSTTKLIGLLEAEGYVPYEFSDWTLKPHQASDYYRYQNILMLPAEKVETILEERS